MPSLATFHVPSRTDLAGNTMRETPHGDMTMRRVLPLFAMLLWAAPAPAASEKLLLPQKPTLSANQIAFTFAGALWAVGREGGEPRRITSSPGLELDAHFSP